MADSDVDSSTSLAAGGHGGSGAVIQQLTQTATQVSVGQKLHLPTFTPKSADAWFLRAESQFRLANISNETTQADLVISMLSTEVFDKIAPWLRRVTGPIKYQGLKQQLKEVYSLPPSVRAQRAINLIASPLGDSKPSEAWDELIELLRIGEVDDQGRSLEVSLHKAIFLSRLPHQIRAQLEGAEEMDEDALVQRANNLHLADKAAKQAVATNINAVSVPEDEEIPSTPDTNAVYSRRPPDARHRSGRHHQQQNHQKQALQKQSAHPPASDLPNWCYYHRVWGNKSRRCTPPCRYPKN